MTGKSKYLILSNNKEPSRGVEPRTSGLEVLRAIQLRHEGSLVFYNCLN